MAKKSKYLKVLFLSDLHYHNFYKVKQLLRELGTLGTQSSKTVYIATRSNSGVDMEIRKTVMSMIYNEDYKYLKYGEFPPYHTTPSMYNIMPEYLFNKRYGTKNFIIRDIHAVKWADIVVVLAENVDSTLVKHAIKQATKLDKEIMYI